MTVQDNLSYVIKEIEGACERVSRASEDITIVAVTKTVGIERTKEVLASGVLHLGENRNEGLLLKQSELSDRAVWHFIGSLQSRKVKEVINKIDYLHSLDRLSLAQEIQKRASREISCFVQVKTSSEESKQGLHPEEVVSFIKELSSYTSIRVVGLMTMAPYTDDSEEIRACFRALKEMQQHVQSLALPHAPCTELSMGMSNDFRIAIEEGATFIRLGTILVGNES